MWGAGLAGRGGVVGGARLQGAGLVAEWDVPGAGLRGEAVGWVRAKVYWGRIGVETGVV